MKKLVFIPLLFCMLSIGIGQSIYLSTTNNRLYRLNIETCNYTYVAQIARPLTDITFHPDKTLYGVDSGGNIFIIDTMNGATTVVHHFNSIQRFNSLTSSADGILYSTGNIGELWSYNKDTDLDVYLGNFGFQASGDLTFYKGNLYAATLNDRIILVDLNDLSNSHITIDDNIPGDIFGIVSYARSCDSLNCYAISSGNSEIYEIDFITKKLNLVCSLNIHVGGGASYYEFYGSAPIILNGVDSSNPSCNQDDGSITINITGGIAPITYSLNGVNFQTSNTFDHLAGGHYQFIAKDVNGCSIIEEATLSNAIGPVITNLATSPTTCGNANGELTVSVSGGNGMIEYSIDDINFQSSPVFQNLPGGNYYITIMDTAGCKDLDSTFIQSIDGDSIVSIQASLTSCNINTGSLSINTSSSAGIQYSLDGITFQQSNHFDQLQPGKFLVTILDMNGCRDTMSATISPPATVTIDNVVSADPLCGSDEGTLTITAGGGTGDISYSINGNQAQPSNIFNHLSPDSYLVTAIDENGCKDTTTVLIHAGVSIFLDSITSSNSHCTLQDGALEVFTSGGTGVIQYSINGFQLQPSNVFDHLSPAEYDVMIVDENGCKDSMNIAIVPITTLQIDQITETAPGCENNNGSIQINAVGNFGEVEYSIDQNLFQTANQFLNLGSGQYFISIHDEGGCDAMAAIELPEPPYIKIVSVQTTSSGCDESNGSLTVRATGGDGILSISIDGNSIQNIFSFQNLSAGEHDLVITDAKGCQLDTVIKVGRLRCKIFIPNTFSPNLDGVNDLFQLSTADDIDVRVIKYLIFDRWGNMIYKAGDFPIHSASFWWDGSFRKINMSSGVFAYYIEVAYEDGARDIFKGDVTLVR